MYSPVAATPYAGSVFFSVSGVLLISDCVCALPLMQMPDGVLLLVLLPSHQSLSAINHASALVDGISWPV